MQSTLLKIINNANKRIYLKIFLLSDEITKYLINCENIDIKVSIHKDWININSDFIEELIKKQIPILIYDNYEYFIIIDNYKINLEYTEKNVSEELLENSIMESFVNNNLYLSEKLIINYKIEKLINEIKDEYRLINFSSTGSKLYQKQINFASLLKKQSNQKALPDVEKFDLYDKNFLNNELNFKFPKEINNLKEEYYNFVEICNKFNSVGKNIKSKYSCGNFNSLILISKDNLNSIIKEVNIINNIKKNINEKYFNMLMNEFYINLENKLQEVLKRYTIHYNKDVENFKKDIKESIPSAKSIKEKLKIDKFIIVELSREMLLDEKVINTLKSFYISNNSKGKLSRLERLIKENKVN